MNSHVIFDARIVSEKAFQRTAGDNTITKVRAADNPSRKNDRNPCRFTNIEGWGKVGEGLAKLSKGDVITAAGELKLDKYTDKNGTERIDDVLVITAFRVQKSTSFFEAAAPDAAPAPSDDLPF